MNRIYRVVYNARTRTCQAVSEHGKGRHKTHSESNGQAENGTSVSATRNGVPFLPSALAAVLAVFVPFAHAAPVGGEVVRGQAAISQQGKLTDIHQTTPKAAINWQQFGIKADETVRFRQPGADSVTLNRVTGRERSLIDGTLTANGHVFIANPNGMLIGKGAKINVGSLLATGADISNDDFMHGKYRFHNGAGEITNLGNITVPEGGTVALIAPIVNNQGTINAPQGTALLASADSFVVKFAPDGLGYTVTKGTLQGLVENGGAVLADGGRIVLTAKGTDSIKKSLIKHSGIAQANTVQNKNGVIELLGDLDNSRLEVSGTLKAEAPHGGDGGFVETSAAEVKIADTAEVSTQSAQGETGTWLIDPTDFTVGAASAPLTESGIGADTLSANLNNGNITLTTAAGGTGAGDIHVNAPVNWSKNTLTLSAHNNININADLNGSGTAKLGLEYGQATDNGDEADYHLKKGSKINLPEGNSFSIKKGKAGTTEQFQVFHEMPEIRKEAPHLLHESEFNATNIAFGKDMDIGYTKKYTGFAGWGLKNFSKVAGLGHQINNLTLNSKTQNNVALFRSSLEGEIRDIGLNNVNVHGDHSVGGLLGSNSVKYQHSYGIEIKNSFVNGNVSGNTQVGGLAGWIRGSIKNSFSAGTVTGSGSVGGLVGQVIYDIENSYSTSNVFASKNTRYDGEDYSANIGGLVGFAGVAYIKNSYATGNVSASGNFNVGGLVGSTGSVYSVGDAGSIEASYSRGNVSNTGKNTGGLVGYLSGNVSNSYTESNVTGSENTGGLAGQVGTETNIEYAYVSGLVASNNTDTTGAIFGYVNRNDSHFKMLNTYFDRNSSKQPYISGLGVREFNVDTGGNKYTAELNKTSSLVGKSTAEMQKQSTFKNWDFDKVWRIDEGKDYPRLRALTEGKITLGVKAPDVSKTYDGVPINGLEDLKKLQGWGDGITVKGLLHGDTVDVGLKNLTIDPTRGGWVGAVNVKQDGYELHPIADVSDQFKQKYEIDWQKGTLMIHPKKVEIGTVSLRGERPYDGTAAARAKEVKELKGIVEKDKNTVKLVGIGTLAGADVVANGTGVQKLKSLDYHDAETGERHTLKLTGAGSENYEISAGDTGSSAWKITKRPVTITGTRVYDGTKQAASNNQTKLHNIVEKDKNTVKLTGVGILAGADVVADGNGAQKLKSLDTLKLTGSSSKNYEISVKDSAWRITKRPLIITAMNNFKPLHEKNPSKDKIGILASGLVDGEVISRVDVQFGKSDKEAQIAELHEVYPVSPTDIHFQKGKGKKENYSIQFKDGKILVIPSNVFPQKDFPKDMDDDKFFTIVQYIRDFNINDVYHKILLVDAVYGAGNEENGIRIGDDRRFHEIYSVKDKNAIGGVKYYFCPMNRGCDNRTRDLMGRKYEDLGGDKVFELASDLKDYRIDVPVSNKDIEGAGLSAAVYRKVGTNEYFVVFRGTDQGGFMAINPMTSDGRTNINQGYQYDRAYEWSHNVVKEILKNQSDAKIQFVGHSLGGGLAAYSAVSIGGIKTDKVFDTTVFNAAQLQDETTKYAIVNYIYNTNPEVRNKYGDLKRFRAFMLGMPELVWKEYFSHYHRKFKEHINQYGFNNDPVSGIDGVYGDFAKTKPIDFLSEGDDHGRSHMHFSYNALNLVDENYRKKENFPKVVQKNTWNYRSVKADVPIQIDNKKAQLQKLDKEIFSLQEEERKGICYPNDGNDCGQTNRNILKNKLSEKNQIKAEIDQLSRTSVSQGGSIYVVRHSPKDNESPRYSWTSNHVISSIHFYENDVVKNIGLGQVSLTFSDGSELVLKSKTVIRIKYEAGKPISETVEILEGSAESVVGKSFFDWNGKRKTRTAK